MVDANVSQSEEEALDKVTVSDILVSCIKPDDERPHSVAVVTSESSCITARLDSTYSLADYDNMGKICQNNESEINISNQNEADEEEEEEDEFVKMRSHLIALRHSRSFDSGLSISKLYQQALLANNKNLRKGKKINSF